MSVLFFYIDTQTAEIYTACHTLPLHAARPILIGPDEPIDRPRLAFDVQFLREALDPSDRVLEQDFERRAAPVRERIALEIIVARQRDELHRLAEVLIPAQLEDRKSTRLNSSH